MRSGFLGEDRGQDFVLASAARDDCLTTPAKRDAYRAVIARERDDHRQGQARGRPAALRATQSGARVLVAVATQGGGRVNQHFGHAKEFQIYEASAEGVRFIGHRKVDAGYCGGGGDAALDEIIKALAGVEAVLCAKIGECPAGQAARRRHHDERRVGL